MTKKSQTATASYFDSSPTLTSCKRRWYLNTLLVNHLKWPCCSDCCSICCELMVAKAFMGSGWCEDTTMRPSQLSRKVLCTNIHSLHNSMSLWMLLTRLLTDLYFAHICIWLLRVQTELWECKTEHLAGKGVETKKNRRAKDIFRKKRIPHFLKKWKIPIGWKVTKCHHLDNSQSWLHPGAFLSLIAAFWKLKTSEMTFLTPKCVYMLFASILIYLWKDTS